MIKLCVFKTTEGDHLLIAIHHLLVDGVSWRILFEDFEAAYGQALQGKPIELGYKRIRTNVSENWLSTQAAKAPERTRILAGDIQRKDGIPP